MAGSEWIGMCLNAEVANRLKASGPLPQYYNKVDDPKNLMLASRVRQMHKQTTVHISRFHGPDLPNHALRLEWFGEVMRFGIVAGMDISPGTPLCTIAGEARHM